MEAERVMEEYWRKKRVNVRKVKKKLGGVQNDVAEV
jgi:hypothetical protein